MIHLALLWAAASVSCPVLNTATAMGAVGEVQLSVTNTTKPEGYVCRFKGGGPELTITVAKLETGQFAQFMRDACRDAQNVSPLKSVGNEATSCSFATADQIEGKAVGRVRKQAFTIVLSANKSTTDINSLRAKISMLAEQVAGNLF